MSTNLRRLPLPAEPTWPADDSIDEPTACHFDAGRALRELLALISRTESLASAAERQLELIAPGPTAGIERRVQRLSDLLVATREAALRALEAGHGMLAELR